MISLYTFLMGLTSLLYITLSIILGLIFIYKSKTTNAKLLFYAGIMVISISFVLLGNCYDFLMILITNKNSEYDTYIIIVTLGLILVGPGLFCSLYICCRIIFTNIIIRRVILIICTFLIIIFEFFLIFDTLNSITLEYPSKPGEGLIELHITVGSPFYFIFYIMVFFGTIICVLGLIYKGLLSYGIVRKKFFLLSISYSCYIISLAFLEKISIISNALLVLSAWTIYLGLKEESTKIKKSPFKKEIKIEESLFRLEESERKLKESEEKYRLITENASDLITIFNNNFEVEFINEKIHEKLLGYSKNELLGRKITDFTHPLDEKNILNMQKILLENEEGTAEIRVMKKDCSYIWLNVKANLFFNENQERKVLTVSTDVSEYKRAQEIIREENFRLKKIDELRKEFMARATHDIKDPLSSVILAMDMLLDMYDNKDFENYRKNFINICTQIKRIKEFAINLLDYTLLEMHQSQIKKEEVNLSKIIFNTIQNEKVRTKERGIEIVSNLPEDLYLFGDTIGLTQIFQNILSNAINYTPKYGNGKIIINVERNNSKIKFSVKDNGIGISSEDMNKLFEWGQKINYNRKDITFGSGIGLYITKRLVEIYDGKIWAESEGIGKGSTFFVEFTMK